MTEHDYNASSNDDKPDDCEPVYATLHFYYSDPDSMRRYNLCNKAEDLKGILFEYDQWLRAEIKYHEKEELQPARDGFWEICNAYEVDPWED